MSSSGPARGGNAVSSASPVLTLRGVSKSFGAVQALREVSVDCRAGEIHALVGENGSREIDTARDSQRVPRSRRGHHRGRRDRAPASVSRREPQARSRHGLSDVLARVAPVDGREPLPRGTVRPATDVRSHGRVGGLAARRVRPRHLADRVRGDALARGTTAPRGRQGTARPAEGVAPRRADDCPRPRGRRPAARARSRAEPRRRRHRLRQPPAAGGPGHCRSDQRSPRRRVPGDVRGRLDVGGEPGRPHDRASAPACVSGATRP